MTGSPTSVGAEPNVESGEYAYPVKDDLGVPLADGVRMTPRLTLSTRARSFWTSAFCLSDSWRLCSRSSARFCLASSRSWARLDAALCFRTGPIGRPRHLAILYRTSAPRQKRWICHMATHLSIALSRANAPRHIFWIVTAACHRT